MNHQITYMLQEIFNLIPDVTEPAFVKSVNVNTNDQVRAGLCGFQSVGLYPYKYIHIYSCYFSTVSVEVAVNKAYNYQNLVKY